MLYHNDSTMAHPPQRITVKGCSLDCPIDEWHQLLSPYLPLNYTAQCNNGPSEEGGDNSDGTKGTDEHFASHKRVKFFWGSLFVIYIFLLAATLIHLWNQDCNRRDDTFNRWLYDDIRND